MSETPPGDTYSFRDVLSNRPLLLALGAVFLGLCLLTIFAILLLRGVGGVGDEGDVTPFPSPVAEGATDAIITGISGSTSVSLTLNVPTALQIGTERFSVRPEPVQADGTWDPEVGEDTTALWVYGTLINYVVGLPDNDENRLMLEGLSAGNEITLSLRDGTQHLFTVTNREIVPTSQTDVFAQNRPSLTLILLRARGDERLVVQADYVADPSASVGEVQGAAGSDVELGETAQLDTLRVTAEEATALYDQTDAPPGFIFYVVDFQVQNAGSAPIDLGGLRFILTDELGNQYAASLQAGQFGAYAPPTGTLPPGQSRQATVGYQIPAGLSTPTLAWIVAREGGTGQIRVVLPFAQSDAASQSTMVSLQGAELSADGTTLLLSGQVTNNGSQPLVVNESNVSMRSDGTIHLMLSTNPAFPWVVPPGQTTPFTVSFQRPAMSEAVFEVANQSFQVSGLR